MGLVVARLEGEGKSHGFVICEHVEPPTFHKVLEVKNGKITANNSLAVLPLNCVQLLRKVRDGAPDRGNPLFQHSSHSTI